MMLNTIARGLRGEAPIRQRLARELLAAVADDLLSDPHVAKAVAAARDAPSQAPDAVDVQTEGNERVGIRSCDASAVVIDAPCDLDAGRLVRVQAERGGGHLIDVADALASANMPLAAMRGALAVLAPVWSRDLFRIDARAMGAGAQAALPFLHSVRAEGRVDTTAGAALSLRLLCEAGDERPVTWTHASTEVSIHEMPEQPESAQAAAAPLIEILADPVFRTALGRAARGLLAADDPGATRAFRLRDLVVTVEIDGTTLRVKCPARDHRNFRRPVDQLLRQAADARVALGERLNLTAWFLGTGTGAYMQPIVREAARALAIGDLQNVRHLESRHGEAIAVEFELAERTPAHGAAV